MKIGPGIIHLSRHTIAVKSSYLSVIFLTRSQWSEVILIAGIGCIGNKNAIQPYLIIIQCICRSIFEKNNIVNPCTKAKAVSFSKLENDLYILNHWSFRKQYQMIGPVVRVKGQPLDKNGITSVDTVMHAQSISFAQVIETQIHLIGIYQAHHWRYRHSCNRFSAKAL